MPGVIFRNAYRTAGYGSRAGLNIYVEDGVVQRVGEGVRGGELSDWVVDCANRIVSPGLANCHTHLAMTLLRGLAENAHLEQWLSRLVWPIESNLTREQVRAGARLGLVELIRNGVTAFADMYFHEDQVIESTIQAGIRILASPAVLDSNAQAGLGVAESVLTGAPRSPLLRLGLGPQSTYSCSQGTLEEVKSLCDEHGWRVHTHLAETRWSQISCEKQTGLRESFYLERLGLVNSRLLAAHSVWITKQEAELLGRNGSSTVFCPVSNTKLAEGGVSPVPELREAGACTTFGTDGAASNNSLNLLETAKFGSLLMKHSRWAADILGPEEAWRMLTTGGYAALGFNPEKLEEGSECDIVTFDAKSPGVVAPGAADPVVLLIYSGGRAVDSFVNGSPVMLESRVVNLDEEAVVADYHRATQQLTEDKNP